MPGVDFVIPDFSYLRERRDAFRGVVLTHGHEDHIGALPYLLREFDVPVYGTPLTLALAKHRLAEHGLLEQADLRPYAPGDRLASAASRVEPIRVTHSIADGIGLAIETPVGTVVHTGDFKLDPHPVDGQQPDYSRFAALGERGVLVLCSDSTNVGRPGHTRLRDATWARRSRAASRRRPGASSSPPSPRTSTASSRCSTWPRSCGRNVALLGRSMDDERARSPPELGYLTVPEGLILPLEELADAARRSAR